MILNTFVTIFNYRPNQINSDKGKYANDGRPGYCKCECRQCRRESAAVAAGSQETGARTQGRVPPATTNEEAEYADPSATASARPHSNQARTTTARVTTVDAERPGKASKLFTLLALPFPDQNVGRRYLDDPNCRKWAGYFSQQNGDEQPRAC